MNNSGRAESRQSQPNPPAPARNPGRGAMLFSLLSVVVCLLLIFYGGWFYLAADRSGWSEVFSYATVGYGLLSLGVLGCAHRSRATRCITASQVISACYLLIYVMVWSAGSKTGFGISGVLLVAFALWCNWFAVNKVVRHRPA